MSFAVVLTAWGATKGAAFAPAVVLGGLVGMRFVVEYTPVDWTEVVAGALWLCVATVLCKKGAYVPGFFCALSGMTYPALLTFGARIEWLGIAPIIADIFLVLALVSIGGGLLAYSSGDPSRSDGSLVHRSLGVAARQS